MKSRLLMGEPVAVSKENQYKQTKLEDLVKKDDELQKLLEGRKQTGTGGRTEDLETVEGVPFKVPKDADAKKRVQN